MKSRVTGKSKIVDNNSEKNRITSIINSFNSLLDIMDKDGNLSMRRVKRMLEMSYGDCVYEINNGIDIKSALKRYNNAREQIIESLKRAKCVRDYKSILADNIQLFDMLRLVSAMIIEMESFNNSPTISNYTALRKKLLFFPMKDLISYNLDLDKDEEEDKEKRIRELKREFKTAPLVAVYATTTSEDVDRNESKLEKIWSINELIKVQKPQDVLEFATTDEAKFKLAYINILYSYVIFDTMPVYDDNTWKEESTEIHRDKDGYLAEASAIRAILTPSLLSVDKFLLMSGYRALECLEKEEYPISEDKLILMCLSIENALKNKKIELSNKFDVNSFEKVINSNPKIIKRKILKNDLNQDDLLNLYIDGKTTYSILSEYVNPQKISEEVTVEQVVSEYKKYKKNEKNNADKFFRIAKLYRDGRIKYKTEKGDILDDEYEKLREELSKVNGNDGIIDFIKMGILDVSAIISFDDENLIKEAFFKGVFSKSDVTSLIDFEILTEREVNEELQQLPESSLKDLLAANLEEINQNPKRRFIYSIDPEARSINAGEGYEIFFVNDRAIIVDTLNKEQNSGKNTIILDLSDFEEEFGLYGCDTTKLFNKKTNGEISINKIAKQKCSQKGLSFGFNQNWPDVMLQILVGNEEERQSKYSEEDLAEQRKIIKLISEVLQK